MTNPPYEPAPTGAPAPQPGPLPPPAAPVAAPAWTLQTTTADPGSGWPAPPAAPAAPAATRDGLKRDIFRVALVLGACVLTFSFVPPIVMGVAAAFDPALSDLTSSSGWDVWDDPLFVDFMNRVVGGATLAALFCGACWFFTIRGRRLVTTDLTAVGERVRPAVIGQLLVLLMGLQFLNVLLVSALAPLLERLGLSLTDTLAEGLSSLTSTPVGLLYVALLGPILEEVIFRGAIMRQLEPYGRNFAIIMSAVLFGLYHQVLWQTAYAIPIGLILGYTAMRFSLKWAALLHIINNSLSVILEVFGVPDEATIAVLAAAAVGSVVLLIVKRGELRALPAAGAPQIAHPYRIAWSRPLLIILAALLLGVGFLTLGML